MILDSPIITGSLLQQAGQFAEIPRYTEVSSSLLSVSASLNAKINALTTDTGSQASRLSNLETKSGSVDTSITNLNSFTQSFSQSVATEFSASNASIASVTGDFSSSVATSFSQSNASLTSLSASVSTVTGNFSASIGQEQINQDSKLNSLISFTGSYATTGSNTFNGTQTISGSTYIQGDLIVLGTSSMQNITGSSVSIGTNTVILNTSNPGVRFGGISVQDSGSSGGTGSLWWDSLNNNWIYENPSGLGYTSAKLISGPQNTGSLGNEVGLTTGKIVLAVGDDHIGNSIMTQTTGKISLTGDLDVSGTITGSTNFDTIVNKPTLVSGSSQLTSSYDTRYVVSGSITQTTWDNIANKPSDIISGAAQVTGSLDFRYRLVGTDITFSELSGKPALISSSLQFNNINSPFTGSFTGSFIGNGSLLTGLTAGGKIHTQSTAQSTWTFIHNLNVQYPNVTVYNLEGQIVLPQSITATDPNTLVLEFGTTVAGYATAGIGGIIEVQGRTVRQYFASAVEWEFEHNLGDRFVNIQTFDSNYEKIIPETIVLTDNLTSTITFPEATSGWAIGTIGGDLPSISSAEAGYTLQVSNTSPYTASWVAIPDVVVSNSLTASYLNPISQSLVPAISGTYDLGSLNKPWRHIYVGTGSIYLVDDSAQITRAITAETIVTTDTLNSGSISLINSLPTGTVSGSSQVVEILTSLNSATASFSPRILNLESKSASVDISLSNINSFTASNSNESLNSKTGSYATTGSNTFFGTQTYSGSVYIANDLIVQGSSSIQYISASSVSIGTNIVQLNTANPSVRFAGLTIIDSGSIGGSGSFLYDSVQDEFIFVHRGNGSNITSSHFVLGPETYDSLGNETYLTTNRLPKGTGKEHLIDSCIFDNGTTVCVNATLKASGQVCGVMGTFSCIGIGTSTPIMPLDICGSDVYGSSQMVISNAGNTSRLYLGTGGGAGSIFYGGRYTIDGLVQDSANAISQIGMSVGDQFSGGSSITFSTALCSGVEPIIRMKISGEGNVGIGSAFSPYAKLVVTKGVQCGCIGKVSDTAIQIDGDGYGVGTYSAQLGFGYPNYGMTYNPVVIAYLPQSGTGSGNADLAFYTRTATTDTAPNQRMRISSTGVTSFTCQICVDGTTLPNDLFALNFLTMGG